MPIAPDATWCSLYFTIEELQEKKDSQLVNDFRERQQHAAQVEHFALYFKPGKSGGFYLMPPVIELNHADLIMKYKALRTFPISSRTIPINIIVGDRSDYDYWLGETQKKDNGCFE